MPRVDPELNRDGSPKAPGEAEARLIPYDDGVSIKLQLHKQGGVEVAFFVYLLHTDTRNYHKHTAEFLDNASNRIALSDHNPEWGGHDIYDPRDSKQLHIDIFSQNGEKKSILIGNRPPPTPPGSAARVAVDVFKSNYEQFVSHYYQG